MHFSRFFGAGALLALVGCSSSNGGVAPELAPDGAIPSDGAGGDSPPSVPPAAIGGACTGPEACASGECSSAWPEGYCTKSSCTTGSCGEGAECYELEGGKRCLAACGDEHPCRAGYACSDTGACVPSCSDTSCGDGKHCEVASGRCLRDEEGPSTGPIPSCDDVSEKDCTGTPAECGWPLVAFDRKGRGWDNYPINGETETNQYRSWSRHDLQLLLKWSAAYVECRAKTWKTGTGGDMALGDMSEQNGAIPGTSIGSPGHPAGTHVNGYDTDIGYFQKDTKNNQLRPICPHNKPDGTDAYHCTGAPDHLDVWRSALVLGALFTSDRVRVIGCDGKVGPLVLAALPKLCAEGFLPAQSCKVAKSKLAFEVTDGGAGWFAFHHHHFHISLKSVPTPTGWSSGEWWPTESYGPPSLDPFGRPLPMASFDLFREQHIPGEAFILGE